MGFINRIREAARRAAEAIQVAGRRVIEAAREAVQFGREEEEEPLYKEETPPDHVSEERPEPDHVSEERPEPEFPYNPPEYEKSLSERLKEADLKAKEEQHRKAFESFNSDFMTDKPISRYEYDLMWDTIGEYANDTEALGSPNLIVIYENMTNKFGYDIDADFVKEFLDHAIQSVPDAMYKEDYMNAIYDAISKTESVEEFYESLEDRVY